jgi:hypothetical protein
MSPREPQVSPPKTFAIDSSRDVLEKLKREIERSLGVCHNAMQVDVSLLATFSPQECRNGHAGYGLIGNPL